MVMPPLHGQQFQRPPKELTPALLQARWFEHLREQTFNGRNSVEGVRACNDNAQQRRRQLQQCVREQQQGSSASSNSSSGS